jgi:hypothetical protein
VQKARLRRAAESAGKPAPLGYAIPRTAANINSDSLSMINTDIPASQTGAGAAGAQPRRICQKIPTAFQNLVRIT